MNWKWNLYFKILQYSWNADTDISLYTGCYKSSLKTFFHKTSLLIELDQLIIFQKW